MRAAFALSLAVLTASACGGGGGPSGPAPPTPGEAVVGPAGATVALGEEASVRIPAGALDSEVTIRISRASTPSALVAAGAFGQAYRFEPEGIQFAVPVEVSILVSDEALAGRDAGRVDLVSTGPGGAERISGIRRSAASGGTRVTGSISHFSVIAPAVPPNAPPTIALGDDISTVVGSGVELTATTGDPDGDPVTVAWTLESRPAGSAAQLGSTTGPTTTLVPDVAGEYRVRATASDSRGGSAADVVVVTASAIVADAGPDQSVEVGDTVTLDGGASVGENLAYSWRFLSTPGSAPTIRNADQSTASFLANAAGEYVVELTVSNGSASDRDTVRIVAVQPNRAPTIDLDAPEAVLLGDAATIVADASDPDDDPLQYVWTLLSAPTGSAAILSGDGPQASLAPDLPGLYVVEVVVSDGEDEARAQIGVFGNPDVAGVYDATFQLASATGCGDVSGDVEVTGEVPIEQPTPSRVVIDLPSLDPLFTTRPAGSLEGTFFFFNGSIGIQDSEGNSASLPATIRGTMDGTALALDVRASFITCTITGTIEGTKQ